MPFRTATAVFAGLFLATACSMRHIEPDYDLRHSNLGTKGDVREVVVTDSKTRFYLTGGYGGVGLIAAGAGVLSSSVVIPLALTGLILDVSLTPYIYKDQAWIYSCPGLRVGHTGVLYLDDPDDQKTKRYIGSLGCKRVGSNPPWLHADR